MQARKTNYVAGSGYVESVGRSCEALRAVNVTTTLTVDDYRAQSVATDTLAAIAHRSGTVATDAARELAKLVDIVADGADAKRINAAYGAKVAHDIARTYRILTTGKSGAPRAKRAKVTA